MDNHGVGARRLEQHVQLLSVEIAKPQTLAAILVIKFQVPTASVISIYDARRRPG